MRFDLWDTETSSYYGRYEDERQALIHVTRLVTRYGEGYAQDLGLGRVDDAGNILEPLSGDALIARAKEVLEAREEERRGVLVASSVQAWKRVESRIEPLAAAAGRTLKRFTAPGQQRTPGG